MSERHRARIALLIAVLAISFAAIFFRKTAPTHPLVASAFRLVIAGVLLLPFTIRAFRRERSTSLLLRDVLVGGGLYALHFGSWVTSLTMTSVAASVTLVTATPLLLAVIGWRTQHDRASRRQWTAIVIAMVGLGVLGGVDISSRSALIGDGLALLGAAAMAGYLLLVRRRGPDVDPLGFTGACCLVGAGLLLLASWLAQVPIDVPTNEAWLFILLAALVPQIVGHGLVTWSLRHVSPTTVGLATVVEPVGATLLAWVWLGEAVGAQVLAGCSITLFAVVVSVSPTRGA